MKTGLLSRLFLLLALPLFSCCRFEPSVDISPNTTGKPLEHGDFFSEAFRHNLIKHIQENTFYDAATVIIDGKIAFNYGDYNLPMNCASARKSIYSMLYGIAVDKGLVDIDRTLAEYGIDDSKQPLTETEKTATLRQLLQARSGIYLKALGESQGMKDKKPRRGEYLPGEHFYYNNFDFNLLPIFLEEVTGKKTGRLIYEWIAVPTGMTYFKSNDLTYEYAGYTDYPQTRLYISCEDLARAGLLMLNNGQWEGKQIISSEWIETTTQATSKAPEDTDLTGLVCEGYGYMWWVDMECGTFWANGAYGQFMIVDRASNMVLVLRNNSGLNPIGFIENQIKNEYEDEASAKLIYNIIIEELNR